MQRQDDRFRDSVLRDSFFVITGGPGSGKSTLVEALAGRGFARTQEAGRAIIRDQVAIDGPALPWADRAAFAAQMLGWEMRSFHAADPHRATLFDRGVPDVLGYLRLCGLPVPDHLMRAAELFRYNATVFIAPHWEAIYAGDEERKQTPAEAEAKEEAMVEAYAGLGYRLVTLPLVPVAERVRFVEERIAQTLRHERALRRDDET